MSQLLSLCLCLSLPSLNSLSLSIIDYGSTLWDSGSANTPTPLVSLHKRTLKAILLKNTTLAISDYNFRSILPLKERLNYKGVLIHKIMSGQVPPSLTAKFFLNQSRHSEKLNIPIPRTDLFKSSLVYSGNVLWNSLPLLDYHQTLKCLNHVTCHTIYIMRWLVGIACYIWWL